MSKDPLLSEVAASQDFSNGDDICMSDPVGMYKKTYLAYSHFVIRIHYVYCVGGLPATCGRLCVSFSPSLYKILIRISE